MVRKFFGGVLVVVALALIGFSFVAGNDAENPQCDGQSMSRSDTCLSSKSGAQSYDDRASDASAASSWLLGVGVVVGLAGAGLFVSGIAGSSNRS
ncbi:hypothetical protein Ntsu_18130 [Nocardia sp. IFM 10818]